MVLHGHRIKSWNSRRSVQQNLRKKSIYIIHKALAKNVRQSCRNLNQKRMHNMQTKKQSITSKENRERQICRTLCTCHMSRFSLMPSRFLWTDMQQNMTKEKSRPTTARDVKQGIQEYKQKNTHYTCQYFLSHVICSETRDHRYLCL
jgi:hypothetical protein